MSGSNPPVVPAICQILCSTNSGSNAADPLKDEKKEEKKVEKKEEKSDEEDDSEDTDEEDDTQEVDEERDKANELAEEKLYSCMDDDDKFALKTTRKTMRKPIEEEEMHATYEPRKKSSDSTLVKVKIPTIPTKKKKRPSRDLLKMNDTVKSDAARWKIRSQIFCGRFRDVYKVTKLKDDPKEYAMKTEMVAGDRNYNREKVEVCVLQECMLKPAENRKHFVELIDRGFNSKFKFAVITLLGPSIEDIRKRFVQRNFSRSTAMQLAIQSLQALWDLHDVGWIHRDLRPHNYCVGIGDAESCVYLIDFGISKRIFKRDSKEVRPYRTNVRFLGTLRFASRACHHSVEQGRRDDIESWIYLVFDLFDQDNGLPWKRKADRSQVVAAKEKFFRQGYPMSYNITPNELKLVMTYVDGLKYASEPDYKYVMWSLTAIAKDSGISTKEKMDWVGLLNRPTRDEDEEPSTDNRITGSEEMDDAEEKKPIKTKRSPRKNPKSVPAVLPTTSPAISVKPDPPAPVKKVPPKASPKTKTPTPARKKPTPTKKQHKK